MAYLWAPPQYRWTDLLNSDYHDHRGSGQRVDRLEVDDWLATFLELCGYRRGRLPGKSGRAELRQVRSDLARLVSQVVSGPGPTARDLEILNRYLRRAATQPRVDPVRGNVQLREIPSTKGLDRVIGHVARTLAETLAKGEPERIKVCANPDCHWVMVDESRNRTRRWCEPGACGNLLKVRQFRARRGHGAKTP